MKGNANKAEIKTFVKKQFLTSECGGPRTKDWTQDVFDAYAVALAAIAFNKKGLE